MKDRARLWNGVEAAEKRKDAQTARDYLLSLPHQLTPEQRRALTKWFVAEQFTSKGYVADIAWHSPDSREGLNHHAHVMVTLRKVDGDGFASTKDRAPAGVHPMKAWKDDLLRLREAWAHSANRFLAAAGLDIRVTHESLKTRGIDAEPDPKLGPIAMQMELAGRESHAGNDRREVAARNAERAVLKAEIAAAAAEEAQLIDLVTYRLRSGEMEPEPVTEDELRKQHAQEVERLAELQRQAARETFVRQAETRAEEAKRTREQHAQEEARRQSEGEIASASARYSMALADHYDVRDPYGSLSRAAMSEYGALVKGQEQLRQAAAKEQDPEKRRLIELRRDIEAHDYMAISSQRLAGISATIAGREDAPQAILHDARAEAYAARAGELRKERGELVAELARREREQKEAAQARAPAEPGRDSPPGPTPPGAGQKQDQQPAAGKAGDTGINEAQEAKLAQLRATQAAYAEQSHRGQTRNPADPVKSQQLDPIPARDDDRKRDDDQQQKGRTERDGELSDAKRAKLDRLQATRESYAEHAAKKQQERDRGGGGGRSGR